MIDKILIGEHSIPTYGKELIWDDNTTTVTGRYAPLVYARLFCNQEELRVLKHAIKKGKRVGLASLSINVGLHEDLLVMTQTASVEGVDKTMVTLYRPYAEGVGTDYYYFVARVGAPLPVAFVDFIEVATAYPAPPLSTASDTSEAAMDTLSDDIVEEVITGFGGSIKQTVPDDGHYQGVRTVWSGRVWESPDERSNSRLLCVRFSDKNICEALEQLKQQLDVLPRPVDKPRVTDTEQEDLPATVLLTPAVEALPPIKKTERADDPDVQIKFFTPDSSWTWYPLEYDGDDTFFGLVDSGRGKSLGYFSLSDLQDTRAGALGLAVERDLHFRPRPLSELYPELHQ